MQEAREAAGPREGGGDGEEVVDGGLGVDGGQAGGRANATESSFVGVGVEVVFSFQEAFFAGGGGGR